MSISARYRDIFSDLNHLLKELSAGSSEEADKALRQLEKANEILSALVEQVGEIPQFKLEKELTPVLLKAHGALDRGRLLFEENALGDRAARVWEVEQRIYRLLNDL